MSESPPGRRGYDRLKQRLQCETHLKACPYQPASHRKEDLWPHIREFSDRAIEHTMATLARIHQVRPHTPTPPHLSALARIHQVRVLLCLSSCGTSQG